MRSVKLCAADHVVPACVAAARCDDKEFFKFRKGHWLVARLVSQHAVWDLCSHKKAPGTSSRQSLDKAKREHVLKARRQATFRGHGTMVEPPACGKAPAALLVPTSVGMLS